jgi:tetratricopeptide (TPR) repeat protein
MKRGLSLGALVLSVATAVAAPAWADPTDRTAAAEDLFQRANGLMVGKEYGRACPLVAESYRLDPAGGTLQNLAVCYEEAGKWASAYARFQELRSLSARTVPPRSDRVKLAEEHIAKVTPHLSRVRLVTPPDHPDGLQVKLDDTIYRAASWSAGILVDPGAHSLLVEAPGKMPFRTTFDIVAEGARDIPVPRLVSLAKPASAGASTSPGAEASGWWTPLRTTGVTLAAVGAASALTGLVLALVAKSHYDDARSECGGRVSDCSRDAVTTGDSARSLANGATVALIGGGSVAALGGALIVLSPRTTSGPDAGAAPRPHARFGMVAAGSVGMGVVGGW